jgi:mono/diheme cytochrome c family protein
MANRKGCRPRRISVIGKGLTVTALSALSGLLGCMGPADGERLIPDDPAPAQVMLNQPLPAPPAAKTPPAPVPPPISGGTMLVTLDDTLVVAADPDRDVVWIVDAVKRERRARVALTAGAEPGRLVEDRDGKIHVVLRGSGQVAKIDPASASLVSLRSVCVAPRGLAYDATRGNLHVACAGGELVTMKAAGGGIERTLRLDRDLRDVVVKGDHLLISRFRSAELLEVDAAGALLGRLTPRLGNNPGSPPTTPASTASPTTAWRMVGLPGGSALMLHQRGQDTLISSPTGTIKYYGDPGPCPCPCTSGTMVSPGLTVFSGAAAGPSGIGPGAVFSSLALIVDVAVTRDGEKAALISPTPSPPSTPNGLLTVPVVATSLMSATDACMPAERQGVALAVPTEKLEPVAGAFDGSKQLWVQSRNPAQIRLLSNTPGVARVIDLDSQDDRSHEGHRLFHTVTSVGIACASCHAEAGDDGHVWTFPILGPRRTQSLRGGILASAPFHWDGDMTSFEQLMFDVFTGRMAGPRVNTTQIRSVGEWLNVQPALPKSQAPDEHVVARGKALFESPAVGCKSCHDGPLLTNNVNADVGTGKAFQVPALRDLAARAPYMHTGCAKTLRMRFDPACGGGDSHGKTSHLSSTEIDELVAYLETL